jgi:hypothetical protein
MRNDLKKTLSFTLGLGYQGHDVFFGSTLSVAPVEKNTTGDIITLQGQAIHAAEITINGRQTAVDARGDFAEKVALLPGFNVFQISSKNTFGDVKTKTIYAYRPVTVQTAVNIPPQPGTPLPTTLIN